MELVILSPSCNLISKYMCFEKTKDISVEVFNMLKNKNEAKTMTKHISCDCKCKFNSTTFNSNQKWNKKTCQCECKNYRKNSKTYSWNPSACICKNSKYLQCIANTLVIECDEIVSVMDIVSTKMINIIVIQ